MYIIISGGIPFHVENVRIFPHKSCEVDSIHWRGEGDITEKVGNIAAILGVYIFNERLDGLFPVIFYFFPLPAQGCRRFKLDCPLVVNPHLSNRPSKKNSDDRILMTRERNDNKTFSSK